LPAITEPAHVRHDHPTDSIVGYVVVQTLPAPRTDVAAFDGASSYGTALAEAQRLRSGVGAAVPTYAVVDVVYACGGRSDYALPAEHVEQVAQPCEAGDGYPDPNSDAVVECIGQTAGPHWHDDCHRRVCDSRACAEHNDL
jgi:hypothetical protein